MKRDVLIINGVEIVLDIAPRIAKALSKNSPGGKRITREERDAILQAVGDALAKHLSE